MPLAGKQIRRNYQAARGQTAGDVAGCSELHHQATESRSRCQRMANRYALPHLTPTGDAVSWRGIGDPRTKDSTCAL